MASFDTWMQNEAFHHPKYSTDVPGGGGGGTEAKAAELPRRNRDISEEELEKAVTSGQLVV
jgi:hypothetical protein